MENAVSISNQGNEQTRNAAGEAMTTNNQTAPVQQAIEALERFRDAVLNDRHHLEKPCLDGDQTNAVLAQFDDDCGEALAILRSLPAVATDKEMRECLERQFPSLREVYAFRAGEQFARRQLLGE